jgi:hypothetical protein
LTTFGEQRLDEWTSVVPIGLDEADPGAAARSWDVAATVDNR